MHLSSNQRKKANKICRKYSGWKTPAEIRPLWEELSEIGIEIGILTGRRYCDWNPYEWEIVSNFEIKTESGTELCDNSQFVYQVYEDPNHTKNEYNLYFA